MIQEQLLGDKSTLDASASNIQDGKFYQTHSYVIKVGESINKYRSVVKDLLHLVIYSLVRLQSNKQSTMRLKNKLDLDQRLLFMRHQY